MVFGSRAIIVNLVKARGPSASPSLTVRNQEMERGKEAERLKAFPQYSRDPAEH
jgi:hypothetical protein